MSRGSKKSKEIISMPKNLNEFFLSLGDHIFRTTISHRHLDGLWVIVDFSPDHFWTKIIVISVVLEISVCSRWPLLATIGHYWSLWPAWSTLWGRVSSEVSRAGQHTFHSSPSFPLCFYLPPFLSLLLCCFNFFIDLHHSLKGR